VYLKEQFEQRQTTNIKMKRTAVAALSGALLVPVAAAQAPHSTDERSANAAHREAAPDYAQRLTEALERRQTFAASRSRREEIDEQILKAHMMADKQDVKHIRQRKHRQMELRQQQRAERQAEQQAETHSEAGGSSPEEYNSNSSVGRNIAIGHDLSMAEWPSEAQFSCLRVLWQHESGWNERAQNPSSGAYGIPQSLPGEKMAEYGGDWQTNPATQIQWGLSYIRDRYGTPCNAWQSFQAQGWY
jgi:hypothetical protein